MRYCLRYGFAGIGRATLANDPERPGPDSGALAERLERPPERRVGLLHGGRAGLVAAGVVARRAGGHLRVARDALTQRGDDRRVRCIDLRTALLRGERLRRAGVGGRRLA